VNNLYEKAICNPENILAGVSSRGSQPRVLFLGLDVHTESIAVSVAPSDSTEVRRYGLIGGTHDDVLRLAKKLQAAHPGHELRFCYEAGPHGYPLGRFLQSHGYACILVAPSKVPRAPGDRVKTNRRDADQLARLYRAGELTALHVPDPQDAAVRDLLRARDQVRQHPHRARLLLRALPTQARRAACPFSPQKIPTLNRTRGLPGTVSEPEHRISPCPIRKKRSLPSASPQPA